MTVVFIVVSFIISVLAVYQLRRYETDRRKILNTDVDILILCKKEWDRQHEIMREDPSWEIHHNQKYDLYQTLLKNDLSIMA